MNHIADRLKLIRGTLSQRAFADYVGLKQTTYGQYERGITSPKADAVSMICERLGLNPRWLLFGEEPMYDIEASHQEPRIKAKELRDNPESTITKDVVKKFTQSHRGLLLRSKEWKRLPLWAKEEIEELYNQVDTLTKERDDAKEAELKAKDEALKAKDLALNALQTKTIDK